MFKHLNEESMLLNGSTVCRNSKVNSGYVDANFYRAAGIAKDEKKISTTMLPWKGNALDNR